MAKIAFSKLGLKKKEDIVNVDVCGQVLEVKQYLPAAEKLELIAKVMNDSMDQNNFMNPVKVDILSHLEIIYRYTNLTFTDKQKEDPAKLYDLLETNGIIETVLSALPANEYRHLIEDIDSTIKSFYQYKNSALGIMEVITSDYSNLQLDAQKLNDEIANPQNLTLLKDVMTKLG